METLSDVLNPTQLNLLSKTLQLQAKSEQLIETEKVQNEVFFRGLLPELKLNDSFSALFSSTNDQEHILKSIVKNHEVFKGLGLFKDEIFETGGSPIFNIMLRPEVLRNHLWNHQATIIQSAWRGTLMRRKVLKEFQDQILRS